MFDTVLEECVSITATGEKNREIPLYIFLNSLSSKQAMLGVYHGYSPATVLLQSCYSPVTVLKLGKFTYPKIAHILYVFLYFYTILFVLSYR